MSIPNFIKKYNQYAERAYGLGQSSQLIGIEDLKALIVGFDNSSKGNRFISLTTNTTVKEWTRGVPFEAIYKISQLNCMLGGDYTKRVNDQRIREGLPADFVPSINPRVERKISKSLWLFKNGTTKIAIFPQQSGGAFYFVKDKDGLREVEKSIVAPYLNQVSVPVASQGTQQDVPIRTYDVESVRAIHIEGKEYMIDSSREVYNTIYSLVKDKLKTV